MLLEFQQKPKQQQQKTLRGDGNLLGRKSLTVKLEPSKYYNYIESSTISSNWSSSLPTWGMSHLWSFKLVCHLAIKFMVGQTVKMHHSYNFLVAEPGNQKREWSHFKWMFVTFCFWNVAPLSLFQHLPLEFLHLSLYCRMQIKAMEILKRKSITLRLERCGSNFNMRY